MAEVPESGKRSPRSGVADLAETLIITLFVVTLVFTYFFRVVTVRGSSMENTLMPDDRIVVNLLDRSPEQGDIILIEARESVTLAEDGTLIKGEGIGDIIVKRVIACPGQTIDIDFASGAVYVDGAKLVEDYVRLGLTHTDGGAFTGRYPVTVPEGYIFVMGDHRSVSKDSRSADIGFVSAESVVGTAALRFYPFKSFGTVS